MRGHDLGPCPGTFGHETYAGAQALLLTAPERRGHTSKGASRMLSICSRRHPRGCHELTTAEAPKTLSVCRHAALRAVRERAPLIRALRLSRSFCARRPADCVGTC